MTVTGSSLRRSTRRFASRLSPPLTKDKELSFADLLAVQEKNDLLWSERAFFLEKILCHFMTKKLKFKMLVFHFIRTSQTYFQT